MYLWLPFQKNANNCRHLYITNDLQKGYRNARFFVVFLKFRGIIEYKDFRNYDIILIIIYNFIFESNHKLKE